MRTTRRSQQRAAAAALLGISLLDRSCLPGARAGHVRHSLAHHHRSSAARSVTVAAALSTGSGSRCTPMTMSSNAQTHGGAGGRQVRIFCYGDSLTAGTSPPLLETFPYGTHLERALATEAEVRRNFLTETNVARPPMTTSERVVAWPDKVVVRWRGLPGWTAATMLEHVDDSSVGLRAALRNVRDPGVELAVILAGTNDLGCEFSTGAGAAGRVADAVTGLHVVAHGEGVPTMAVSIPSSGWQHASGDARRLADDANGLIRSWCTKNRENVHFVDFPFGWSAGDDRWATDGLHLSPKGYRDMGELLAPAVGDLIYPE